MIKAVWRFILAFLVLMVLLMFGGTQSFIGILFSGEMIVLHLLMLIFLVFWLIALLENILEELGMLREKKD